MTNNRESAWTDERGTTAVEFAIIAPVFISFVVGILYICMGLFLVGSLHYAVEEGARCASVRNSSTQSCKDATGIINYTKSRYFGPSSSPIFTYAAAACGNSVSASITYDMNFVLTKVSVPLSATACFP